MDNIVSYIAIQLANPTAAANFLNEVKKCYGYSKSNPLIYERCHDAYLERVGYHKATIRNYMLVYKVDEAFKAVIIHRFFYGAQDYLKLI
jgi:plasmid stabilization system protein ParE